MSVHPTGARIPRRVFLVLGALGGAGIVSTGVVVARNGARAGDGVGLGKRGAIYRPDAAEVQNFYRVNRYPSP